MKDEALRLAECLEGRWALHPEMQEAAAELRRLHAENEAFGVHLSERMKDLAKVEAQRDALLEACKTLVALPETEDWVTTLRLAVEQARAAIKQAEGEKT